MLSRPDQLYAIGCGKPHSVGRDRRAGTDKDRRRRACRYLKARPVLAIREHKARIDHAERATLNIEKREAISNLQQFSADSAIHAA